MKRKTHSTEEIIRILRQADGGNTAQSVCREHNVSKAIFLRWKRKDGEMDLADAKRYIEIFYSRFRDECLNREWLLNLRGARVVIED